MFYTASKIVHQKPSFVTLWLYLEESGDFGLYMDFVNGGNSAEETDVL